MENKGKRVHFMGIAGSGCSAAAIIAKAHGFEVSGCDKSNYSEYQTELEKAGIRVDRVHTKDHLTNIDLLVVSPAIFALDDNNEEVVAARDQDIPVMTWQQFSGEYLQKDKFVIAIAGTHGKSTTTAMTALILEAAGLDPTVQLGAMVPQWGSNYRIGKSKYFVIEADEFGNNFLHYHPDIAAITNIEFDHPEFFADQNQLIETFRKFVANLKPQGKLLIGKNVQSFLPDSPATLSTEDQKIELQIPGEFNQDNAAVAAAVAAQVGVSDDIIKQTLRNFTGLGRRFSLAGEINGIKIYDDYGHHPTALLKTSQAAREKFPTEKIILVFQPHMFTRTKSLFNDFVSSLQQAPVDQILVVDIFASREHDFGDMSSRQLVNAVNKPSVVYGGSLTNAKMQLLDTIQLGNTIICMGAGDIIQLSKGLMQGLQQKYGN